MSLALCQDRYRSPVCCQCGRSVPLSSNSVFWQALRRSLDLIVIGAPGLRTELSAECVNVERPVLRIFAI
jgi:hypothetical protein